MTSIEAPLGAPDWARERASLWNQAEAAEKRKNSTVAREVEVALPTELQAGQLRYLVQEYSQWLVKRYGVAVDWAIHAPHRHGDERNYHAHILMTTRILGPEGFAAKCRVLDAKETGSAEVRVMREQWAALVNRSLEQAGIEARVDHRRLEEQGIVRDPQIHAGPAVTAVERKAAAPEPTPMGVVAAIAQTGGTTTVGQHLAAIVDLNRLREERERQRRLVQERKAAAKRELAASHREPMPDRVVIAQAVAALVVHEAARERENIRCRWEERQWQRTIRQAQEREARRQKLLALAQALAKDQACGLSIRQAYLDAGYQLQQQEGKKVFVYPQDDLQAERKEVSAARKAWDQRKRNRELDHATEQETRPGIRYPDKPHWQRDRERILTKAYSADLAEKMSRWFRIEQQGGALVLSNHEATITDHGDRVTAAAGNEREIQAMVEIARAKGWQRVHLTGTEDFQERAAQAFVAAGFALDNPALEQRARQVLEAERREVARERAAREREAALVEQQERETRPGIRHADRTRWDENRATVLARRNDPAHTARAAERGFYSRWMDDLEGLIFERNRDGATLLDQGPVVLALRCEEERPERIERDATLAVLYAQGTRGWKAIDILGPEPFRLAAAKVALEEGLTVSDPELTKRAQAVIEAERQRVSTTQEKTPTPPAPKAPEPPPMPGTWDGSTMGAPAHGGPVLFHITQGKVSAYHAHQRVEAPLEPWHGKGEPAWRATLSYPDGHSVVLLIRDSDGNGRLQAHAQIRDKNGNPVVIQHGEVTRRREVDQTLGLKR